LGEIENPKSQNNAIFESVMKRWSGRRNSKNFREPGVRQAKIFFTSAVKA